MNPNHVSPALCSHSSLARITGGPGSIFPPYCDYGSQNTYCGPRAYAAQGSNIGDDSCEHANDYVCNDGGPGSVFTTNTAGDTISICNFATDHTDCPQRTLTTLGPLSFSAAGRPAAPYPPPFPPRPPPSPPPAGFTACSTTCTTATNANVCSDGGEGAFLVGGAFECDYGTQCNACGTRLQVNAVGSDSYSGARNGVCDDTAAGGVAGYGKHHVDLPDLVPVY